MRPCVGVLLVSGTVLLSLDMLYLQIISHCIDDAMMTFNYETVFGLLLVISCCGLCVWCRLRIDAIVRYILLWYHR